MSRFIQFLIVLGVPFLSGSLLQAADPTKAEVPGPLPKEVVAAWEKAGMEVGWSEVMRFGELAFHPAQTPPQAGWLPAFRVGDLDWRERKLKGLPAPETP